MENMLNQLGSTITDYNANLTNSNLNSCLQTTPYYYYQTYPVYVYQDRTKKAIDILQHLQTKKLLEIKSVTKFIETVNEIASLL